MSVAAGVLAATLIVVGCGERAEPPDRSRIADPQPSVLRGEIPLESRWLIPPDASLEPPLAAPIALDVDGPGGRLYILELQPPELRVHGLADGRFIEALGRGGDGPGEYRHPTGLSVNAHGMAAVLSMSGRVTFWTRGGGLAGIVHSGAGLATDVLASRTDTFYVKADRFPPDDFSEFRAVTPDTALTRPLYRDTELAGIEESGRRLRNHSYAVAATPAGDLLLSPPGPDYRILRILPGRGIRQEVTRPDIPPLRRSTEEMEAVRENVRKGFAAAGRAAPQDLSIPSFRSHVARLAVGPDGSVWALTQRGHNGASIIDCFSPDGEFLASYRIGLRVSDLAVAEGAVYMLAHGELNVPGIAVASRPEARRRGIAFR